MAVWQPLIVCAQFDKEGVAAGFDHLCQFGDLVRLALARELGLELVITDHHEFAAELPSAVAIVHPRLPGTSYPFGGLCGAGAH